MKSPIKNRFLFLPALLLSLPLALAQAPSGSVSFAFGPATCPVWNFTGSYSFNEQMVEPAGAVLPLSFQAFMTHDLDGRLRGSGTTIVTIGQDVVAGNYTLNGTVRGGGNATRATFTVTIVGDGLDVIAGERRAYRISLTYKVTVDPELLAWVVPPNGARGSVHISGLGSTSVSNGGFAVPLPPGVNGNWSVNMDIVPLSRLAGSALIVINSAAPPDQAAYLPDTLTLNTGLAGTYRPAVGSEIQLAGLPGSQPATLKLTLDAEAGVVKITGKLLGQTVSYISPSAGL